MNVYALVEAAGVRWWGRLEDEIVLDAQGGRFAVRKARVLQVLEAASLDHLDWARTTVGEENAHHAFADDSSPFGWVDRDGQGWGCGWARHRRLAEGFFGVSEYELELRGYVKITHGYAGPRGLEWWAVAVPGVPTPAQRAVLVEAGLDPDAEGHVLPLPEEH